MATFADDTAIMEIGETIESSTRKLQSTVNKVAFWTRKWRIKLNESNVRFEVFTAVTMKNGVFWVVTPCACEEISIPWYFFAAYVGC
jgi:hypothetical protein